jgi:hypothetical protein
MGEFYRMTRKRLRRQVVEFVDVRGFDDPQESFALKLSGEYQVRGAPIKVLRRISEDQLKNWRPRQPVIVVVKEEPGSDVP